MGDLGDIGQKLKGKAQQLKGDFNQERGEGLKGGIQKLKGKANESIADAKLKSKHGRSRTRNADDDYSW